MIEINNGRPLEGLRKTPWSPAVHKAWEEINLARSSTASADDVSRRILQELQLLVDRAEADIRARAADHATACNNEVTMLRGATEALLARYLDRAVVAEATLAAVIARETRP